MDIGGALLANMLVGRLGGSKGRRSYRRSYARKKVCGRGTRYSKRSRKCVARPFGTGYAWAVGADGARVRVPKPGYARVMRPYFVRDNPTSIARAQQSGYSYMSSGGGPMYSTGSSG